MLKALEPYRYQYIESNKYVHEYVNEYTEHVAMKLIYINQNFILMTFRMSLFYKGMKDNTIIIRKNYFKD